MKDTAVRDKDGLIIYDPTDDAFEEDECLAESDDALFTDEYMLAFAEKADAEIRRAKIIDRFISVGVITGTIAYTAFLFWLFL